MPDLHPNYTIAVNGTKYSVHMIYIDSVGEFTFKRTMPKTDKLIKDMYKAFEFKYLHKVGENTAPNEKAFLMNKISETVIDVFKNRSSILKDIDLKTYCEMDKSKLSFAPRYFKQNGYKTMHAEDYWRSPLQYHDYCKGIEKFDHDIWTYNRPSWTDKTLINAWNSRCLESFQVTLDNLHSYITKYQNQNTYSFNFMTMLQHDSLNGLYHADDSFANFFKENTKQFENSFIIFSSDHGVRYGKYREQTDIAAYEDNNPFLRLIVPKALRSDKMFMELVKENSRKYVSQYDVFATMIDVLTEGARTNFKDLNYVDFDKVMKYHVVGQSFLREMKERDEFEMGVPINYHFYKRHKVELNDTFYPEIKKFVIERVIENINLKLVSGNLTKICTKLFLKEKAAQHVYVVNIKGKAYFDFQVRTTPGTGIFIGMLDNNFQSIERVMRRVSSYAYEAESCTTRNSARQFCFCKKLLPG
uniref:Sulfatase domain-containing protein n=1 Tax=Rhabditophanes sp. KR3021 TaxID=114890 RepID=A0AC35TQI5_9BILA